MNLKELRIGNTVQDYNERPVTVTKDIIYFFKKIGCDQNTALIPKPLTVGVIESAIFEWPNSELSVCHGMGCDTSFYFVIGNYYREIKFMHELQNLYLDFVNKDLKFK